MQLTKINGKYELLLPEHRANRREWSLEYGGWEVERIEAMLDVLTPKDVLFDIGTEEGDISALLVKESGCNIVMFEPNERVWPCIKVIWEANNLEYPMDFMRGFLSSQTTLVKEGFRKKDNVLSNGDEWTDLQTIIPDHGFKQLYENYPDVPQMTLDDYCQLTGIYPTVITMDVEGSEFEVIKGAQNVLKEKKPIIFMSVHPEFMFDSYRNEEEWKEKFGERQHVVHMLRFIDELGYKHSCIEYDYHELHMRFDPL